MAEQDFLSVISGGRRLIISISTILYVLKVGNSVEIHVSRGGCYETRLILSEIEKILGDGFIKVNRGCLVSVMAIHDIADKIYLSNGESLVYTLRKKNEIINQFREKQKYIINNLSNDDVPMTKEEYKKYYQGFDHLPFAFTDIEMVFDENKHAVDWIFRYGNSELAKLEKLPLEQLIDNSFGSLFANMDSKWLRGYERATLYGETIEVIDYSPEIDTSLKVICFPTFKGHCGCMLFDISNITYTKNSSDADISLMKYLGIIPK